MEQMVLMVRKDLLVQLALKAQPELTELMVSMVLQAHKV
jgi:hypothetical protein